MEIYVNSTQRTVTLDVPVDPAGSTMDVRVYEGTKLVHTVQTVEVEGNTYNFALPFDLVTNEKELKIQWEFSYIEGGEAYDYDQSTYISVVQPLLTEAEVASIVPNLSTKDYKKIERATRYIIQAHTGQTFGRFVGDVSVTGSGERQMILPRRLLTYTTINGTTYFNSNLALRGDGWYLINKSFGIPSLKADFHGLHYLRNGIIEAPASVPRLTWLHNQEYVISGVWGWERVPEPVKEAAKLLVNDYSCGDNIYRDRYLNSISAVDWRIEFNAQAFAHTGNVRADQLLANYVLKRGWAVV